MTTNWGQFIILFQNLMSKSTWLVQLTWLSELEFTNKYTRFSCFWVLFVIKQWNRVEGSSLKTSAIGLHGWKIWSGCHNLSFLSVSKKISGNLVKLHIFLGFENFILSNSETERKVVFPKTQVNVQMIVTIDVAVRIWVHWA